MFDTKIVIVVREDLAAWQKLNVTAFLASGVFGGAPEAIGEAYEDREGSRYSALSVQPVVILKADQETLRAIHGRALARGVQIAAYIEEMFATGHDAANRAVFHEFVPADAKLVGIGLRAERKVVDKIVKGARMHD